MNDIFTATLWIRCCENTHVHTHTALTCRPGRFRNGQMSVFSSLFALFLSCALVRMWRVGSAQREGTRVQRCVGIIRCSEHIYSHTEGRLPQWEHRLCLHSSCPASPRISHPSYLHTLPLRYSHTLNKPTCTNCFIIQMYNWLFYIYITQKRAVQSSPRWKNGERERKARQEGESVEAAQSHGEFLRNSTISFTVYDLLSIHWGFGSTNSTNLHFYTNHIVLINIAKNIGSLVNEFSKKQKKKKKLTFLFI